MNGSNRESERRVTFYECLMVAARSDGLVAEFDRLKGTHLSTLSRRAPLDALIDQATGRDAEAFRAFIAFVWDCVWCRLPEDVRVLSDIEASDTENPHTPDASVSVAGVKP